MPKVAKHLLIGSTEAYSGKSATILGLAQALMKQGINLAYGKPLSQVTIKPSDGVDPDVQLMVKTLNLPPTHLQPTLLWHNPDSIQRRLQGDDLTDYGQQLAQSCLKSAGDLLLLEGPASLDEGQVFDLSLPQIAEIADAQIVLVARFHDLTVVDTLLCAQQRLGDRLLGVVVNDVPEAQREQFDRLLREFLEAQGIRVLGLLPRSTLLQSVSVAELVRQLDAEVLCCGDRLSLMVEQLAIGAMNVNSALKYFRKARHMAVVTGGDRTDIQLAALESSTHCLILTGHFSPNSIVLNRAEDLEVPVLLVDLDTLTTVEIVDQAFGQAHLHEPVKVDHVQQMMSQYFDWDRLLVALGLDSVIAVH